MIRLPPDRRGQRLLAAGGSDGWRGKSISGIHPVDGRRFRPLAGQDYLGGDNRDVSDTFDWRTDRDPALPGHNIHARTRAAGPLGHAGRAAYGGGGGSDAGMRVVTEQEIGKVVLADGGELSHAAGHNPPFQAAVGTEIVVATADPGHHGHLASHGLHDPEGRERHGHVAIGRDDRQTRRGWPSKRRNCRGNHGGRSGRGRYDRGRCGHRRGIVPGGQLVTGGGSTIKRCSPEGSSRGMRKSAQPVTASKIAVLARMLSESFIPERHMAPFAASWRGLTHSPRQGKFARQYRSTLWPGS